MTNVRQVRLSKGLYALVDAHLYDWICQWKWTASHESRGTKWYAIRWEKGVKLRMHRVILERSMGTLTPGLVVDHINDNSLDNRTENLDLITQTENMKRSPGWKKKGQKVNGLSASTDKNPGRPL